MDPLPKKTSDRVVGKSYKYKGEERIWDGKILRCKHNREKKSCRDCGGSMICIHGRYRSKCVECGGSSICEHGLQRIICKECGGSQFCEHQKIRSHCVKCGGGSICEHNRYKHKCIDCGGSYFCEHGRIKQYCVECGGSSMCEHDKQRRNCKICGGEGLCIHGINKYSCAECGGSQICEHSIRKYDCMICEPESAFIRTFRTRINSAIARDAQTEDELVELLGCSISEAREYIESQFSEEMNWGNHGKGDDKWHIDHRRPCASFDLTNEDDLRMCFHYTNLQPLMQKENLTKLAKFDESTFQWYWNGEKWIEIESIN